MILYVTEMKKLNFQTQLHPTIKKYLGYAIKYLITYLKTVTIIFWTYTDIPKNVFIVGILDLIMYSIANAIMYIIKAARSATI